MNLPTYLLAQNLHGPGFTSPTLEALMKKLTKTFFYFFLVVGTKTTDIFSIEEMFVIYKITSNHCMVKFVNCMYV